MVTLNAVTAQKSKFVEGIARRPNTKRLTRDISFSDALLAVEWLNAANGTPAYRRVLAGRRELEELGAMLDSLIKQRNAARARRPHTRQEILNDHSDLTKWAGMQEQFRHSHNAFNRLLSRYSFVPALAYSLDAGVWHFNTIPKRTRGRVVKLNDPIGIVRVSEAAVVAALARLATRRELYKVRLCEQCGQRWLVSKRRMDRFCGQRCREEFYAKSLEYRPRKAANQRAFRDRQKLARVAGANLK